MKKLIIISVLTLLISNCKKNGNPSISVNKVMVINRDTNTLILGYPDSNITIPEGTLKAGDTLFFTQSGNDTLYRWVELLYHEHQLPTDNYIERLGQIKIDMYVNNNFIKTFKFNDPKGNWYNPMWISYPVLN